MTSEFPSQPRAAVSADEQSQLIYEMIGEQEHETGRVDVDKLVSQRPDLEVQIREIVAAYSLADQRLTGVKTRFASAATIEHPVQFDHHPPAPETFSVPPVDNSPALEMTVRFTGLTEYDAGGFGRLYKGEDEDLGRSVAIKILAKRACDPEGIHQFEREAELTSQLHHPGIVPVYGRGTTSDNRPFFVMPFLQEGTLSTAIDKFHEEAGGRYNSSDDVFADLLRRFVSACETVAYAHDRGVLHRDIKPKNIMLGRFGETQVIDWGMAEKQNIASDTVEDPLRLRSGPSTSQGGLTPEYASPEQFREDEELTVASDVYNLGATLYKIVTGSVPIRKTLLGEVRRAVLAGDFEQPRVRHASVPKALNAVTMKAMALRPADRYMSAMDLARDVNSFLEGKPTTALPENSVERLFRVMRRQLTLVIGLIAALILLILVLSWSTVAEHKMQREVVTAARQRLSLAATLAARVGGAEIDRRWRMLELAAADPALRQAVIALNDSARTHIDLDDPANPVNAEHAAEVLKHREQVQAWLADLYVDWSQIGRIDINSMGVNSVNGDMVARTPRSERIGDNYAWRAYFHGKIQDLPEGVSAPPATVPVISPVYMSKSTETPSITLSVGIPDEAGKVIGRLSMTMAVGDLGLFQDLGENQIPILVEARDTGAGNEDFIGIIADHPKLAVRDVADGSIPRLRMSDTGKHFREIRSTHWMPDFHDPIDEYRGEAVAVPIYIPGRPHPVDKSGWFIILRPAVAIRE